MAPDFVPMITRAGIAAVRSAQGNGLQATIAAIAVGTGFAPGTGWAGYAPTGAETTLKAEKLRAPILYATPLGGVAGGDPIGFSVVAEFAQLPAGSADVPIVEVGIFLDDGTLFALWSSPTEGVVIGSLTPQAVYDLAFDLYLTVVPVAALAITVLASGPTENLACLAQLLRGLTRDTTRQIQSAWRLGRRGIRE